jgi:hypothetical protein
MWILVSCVFAQAPSASVQEKKQPPAAATATPQPAQPAEPSAATPAAVPEPPPAQPPVVSWDGKLLTIDAENSTLEQILIAIRAQTNASMDIPASAASDRVALHIGPAPIRDALSQLLYGSSFDYVIQSADDDPEILRSLILTARGQADDPGDNLTVAVGPAKKPGVRMMRGYAAPGKPDFQAAAEAALAAQKAAAEDSASTTDSASAADSASSANSASPAPDSGSPAESHDSQAVNNNDAQSATSAAAPSSADASGITVSDIPPNSTSTMAASAGSSGDQSEISQKMQDMMHMFEQRKQIQAQQNQAASQPPANN